MSRKNRFAPPGYWLHITQRGNDKQRVFLTDADREYFVMLMALRSEECAVRFATYGLMSNHFHLVAVGDQADAVSLFMMDLNGLRHPPQRDPPAYGPRLAGSILFVRARPRPLNHRHPVRRTEPGARPDGGSGGRLGVVIGACPSGPEFKRRRGWTCESA